MCAQHLAWPVHFFDFIGFSHGYAHPPMVISVLMRLQSSNRCPTMHHAPLVTDRIVVQPVQPPAADKEAARCKERAPRLWGTAAEQVLTLGALGSGSARSPPRLPWPPRHRSHCRSTCAAAGRGQRGSPLQRTCSKTVGDGSGASAHPRCSRFGQCAIPSPTAVAPSSPIALRSNLCGQHRFSPLQRTCSKIEGRQRSKGSPQLFQVGAVCEPLPDRHGPLVADPIAVQLVQPPPRRTMGKQLARQKEEAENDHPLSNARQH